MSYLSIDPGLSSGWAFFRAAGEIVTCGAGDPRLVPGLAAQVKSCIIEKPVIYRAALMKGDPNCILTLAIQVGRYVEYFESRGARVALTTPGTWKGQVPKHIHHERVRAGFSDHERMVVEGVLKYTPAAKQRDVLDAVALGLAAFSKKMWAG